MSTLDKPENGHWPSTCVLSTRKVFLSLFFLSILIGLHAAPFNNNLRRFPVIMDEICFNGLDDDDDGLFDAYDPDCSCIVPVNTDLLVPNGQFELFDECCQSMDSQDGVCLEDWFLVTVSPDLVSPACPSDIGLFDMEGVGYDGSFIDIGFSSSPAARVRSESLGVCLNSPLSECELYTISFSTAILSIAEFGDMKDEVFSIYGLPVCPDTTDIDVTQSFCESPLFAQAQEIATVNLIETDRDEWVKHVQNFQPDFEIRSIVLYANCNQDETSSSSAFLYLDDIEILPVGRLCDIEGEIFHFSSLCGDEVTLIASAPIANSYQWYRDSIPIEGATDSTISVTLTSSPDAYSALVYNEDDCLLLDPVTIHQLTTESDITYDTLCPGGEYIFYDSLILDAGIYTELVGQTSEGCDSLVVLDLYFHPIISSVVDIQPGLILDAGETLVITPDANFLDQLSSYRWLEQSRPINATNSTLRVRLDEAQVRNFTFEYTGMNGCTLTTGFTAEWGSRIPVDEDCDNGVDDDLDGLIDTFDSDCPCSSEHVNHVMLSETICHGSIYTFGDYMLDEAGIYSDTFVNVINCDSIVTVELTIMEDYKDTIQISISEGESYNFEGTDYSESGFYSFPIEDNETSCDSLLYLNLVVIPPFAIYIPNVISLSATTGNNEFLISTNAEINIVELLVFNRWGNIVHNKGSFSINDDDTYIWDGLYNGQQVAQGLYIYKLTYKQGEESNTVIGDLTVIE